MAIKYPCGYTVLLTPDGILAQELADPFLTCGMAILFRPGDRRTVMDYPHYKIHRSMPTLLMDPESPMSLRGNHEEQATHGKVEIGNIKPLTEEQRIFFKDHFNVDEAAVKAAYARD